MLKVKRINGVEKVYDTISERFVRIQYNKKHDEIRGNRILADLGEYLQADESKNERLILLNARNNRKVIALIVGKNLEELTSDSVNELLQNPNNNIYFFNDYGEYLVDIQGYKGDGFELNGNLCTSVNFFVRAYDDVLKIEQKLTLETPNGETLFKTKKFEFPYEDAQPKLELYR